MSQIFQKIAITMNSLYLDSQVQQVFKNIFREKYYSISRVMISIHTDLLNPDLSQVCVWYCIHMFFSNFNNNMAINFEEHQVVRLYQ